VTGLRSVSLTWVKTVKDDDRTYKIVRMYFKDGKRVIKRGLTLEEAQEHCNDPETSSSTCKKVAGNIRTEECGPWFDGYEEE
jgi:hypothetical protein